MLTLVSLFDGIGGFPLAFSRAGFRTKATVEIDKAAAGVTAEHFPDAQHFSDVTEVTGVELLAAGFDPRRGVVTGGWPCTDLSLAGLRLGLGGARSGLVGQVFRLLGELRPRWFVLENVPGLLSSVCPCPGGGVCGGGQRTVRDGDGSERIEAVPCADSHPVRGGACGRRVRRGRAIGVGRCMALHGGGMGTVLRSLGERGYGVAYRVLDAQHFGVPQRRRRVVIVGCLGDWAAPVSVLFEPGRSGGDHPAGSTPGPGTTGRADRGADRARREVVTSLTTSSVGGIGGADDNSAQAGHLVTHALTAEGADASEDGAGRETPLVVTAYQEQGSNVGPMGTLRAGSGTVTGGVPFLPDSPIAFGQKHGFDPQVSGVATPTLRANGDGAGVAYALRDNPAGVEQEKNTNHASAVIAPTITAAYGMGGVGDGGKQESAFAAFEAESTVRRLTPVECERLQGYPDGWTAVSAGREQKDSPRYKQLGNSIAVPVFEWVARRIAEYENSTITTEGETA